MKIFLYILLLTTSTGVLAEMRYVTDRFKVTMRTGESATHRILTMLPTGAALELVSNNPATGYSQVRTEDGKVGYVLTRQLQAQPVARDRLAALQARVAELETAPGQLSTRLAALQKQHNELQTEHQELQEVKQQVETEFATLQRTAANAVRISKERTELRKLVANLTRETEELKQQKRELENSSAQRWFLIGGGVVVGGIVLGLILPNLRIRRRRESWGSL